MEEILASIRRIIESNEPGAVHDEPVSHARPEVDFAADDEVTNDFVDTAHPVVADSTGMPLRAANTAIPPRLEREAPAAPVEKPQSLADIAARVRNASDRLVPQPAPVVAEEAPVLRQPEPVFRQPEPVPHQPEPFAQAAPLPPVVRAPEPQRPVAVEPQHRPSAALRASLQPQPPHLPAFDEAAVSAAGEIIARYETEVAPAAPVQAPVAPVQAAAPAFAPLSIPLPEAAPRRPAFEPAAESAAVSLLSSETGALVARSFGELAEAVDGAQRRSLDEIAEELLRPMLREWLDDNLPTLVERLVREEIERVARGPRR